MRAGVLTVSDGVTAGTRENRSGARATELMTGLGFQVVAAVVPDEIPAIQDAVRQWVEAGLELVVTTGGTGISPRDVTPEAIGPLLDRWLPGLPEAARAGSKHAMAMLSRGMAGAIGGTLVVCLPGSVGGVEEWLSVIGPVLTHAVELARGVPTQHSQLSAGPAAG